MGDSKTNRLLRERWKWPDEAILREIENTKWTSHNIPLTSSTSTLGDHQPLISDDIRMRIIKENLGTFFAGNGTLSGLNLVDLGCLEGGLSFEMAREDMNVLGVEGRESNFRKCELIKRYFSFPNLDFIHLDVKELNRRDHGVFDVALCCGLLYHLDDPVGFLKNLSSIVEKRGVLFLDTHIAPSEEMIDASVFKEKLSPIESFNTDGAAYQGRWYSEFSRAVGRSDEEWAAVSNYRSFWLTCDSLMKALYRAGFQRIYRIHGGFGIETEIDLFETQTRVFFVAIKGEYFLKES